MRLREGEAERLGGPAAENQPECAPRERRPCHAQTN